MDPVWICRAVPKTRIPTPRPPTPTNTPTPNAANFFLGFYPDPEQWFTYTINNDPFRAGVVAHRDIPDCYATVMTTIPWEVDPGYLIVPATDPAAPGSWAPQTITELGRVQLTKFVTSVPGLLGYQLRVSDHFCDSAYLEVHHPEPGDACLAAFDHLVAEYTYVPGQFSGSCG